MDTITGAGLQHERLSSPVAERPSGPAAMRVIVHDEPTAAGHMAYDERLADEGIPTLRLFRWNRPALSFGYRQRPPAWIAGSGPAAAGVDCVERPTGGGVAVHGSDLSCSVVRARRAGARLRDVMAALCEGMSRACRAVDVAVAWNVDVEAATPIAYCLTQTSPYALTVGRRKLCGFAVRAYGASWLIQGSLLVRAIPEAIQRLMPPSVRHAYDARAICLEEAAGMGLNDAAVIDGVLHAMRDV